MNKFSSLMLMTWMLIISGEIFGKPPIIRPDSIHIGMTFAEFEQMYAIDAICSKECDGRAITYVETESDLYRRQTIYSKRSYLTFVDSRFLHCVTVFDDSAVVASLRTRVFIHHYTCVNSNGVCFAFQRKSGRAISAFHFNKNTATADFRDKRIRRYRIPLNPLFHGTDCDWPATE